MRCTCPECGHQFEQSHPGRRSWALENVELFDTATAAAAAKRSHMARRRNTHLRSHKTNETGTLSVAGKKYPCAVVRDMSGSYCLISDRKGCAGIPQGMEYDLYELSRMYDTVIAHSVENPMTFNPD